MRTDPRTLELALRKQRLQLRAASQRADLSWRLEGVDATLDRVDGVREHFAWAKEQAPLLSLGALALLAARPRLSLRIAKRAWLGWLLYKRLHGTPAALLPVLAPALRLALRALKRALGDSAGSGSTPRRQRRTG